jgi:thermolysin
LCAAALGAFLRPAGIAAQSAASNGNRVGVAATTTSEIAQWSTLLDSRISGGAMLRQARYADPLDGRIVESFVQRHRGVEVYGGDVARVTEAGRVIGISGTVYANVDVDTRPTLDAAAAAGTIQRLAGSGLVAGPALSILPTFDGRFALAYRGTTDSAKTYFIDAHSGESLLQQDEIFSQASVGSGTGALGDRKKVSVSQRGGTFATWDLLRPGAVVTLDTKGNVQDFIRLRGGGQVLDRDVAIDEDNVWTAAAVVDTHANLGFAYDYFYKRHNYQGMDGTNGAIVGVVNAAAILRNNAFFISPPLGPGGSGGLFFGASDQAPFTVLDVVGHELMHGITHASLVRRTGTGLGSAFFLTSGPAGCDPPFFCDNGRFVLVSNESGAVNEGFSDVFGTAVEFYAQPAGNGPLRADYVSGEDLSGVGGRSLADPGSGQILPGVSYPDHVSNRVMFPLIQSANGPFLVSGVRYDLFPAAYVGNRVVNQRPYISGQGIPLTDAGGVHMNLSIVSHAFFLAIEGGRNGTSGRTVDGVGAANREQVERVFFVAVRDLLPRFPSFAQTAAALREAARQTYGPSANVARAVDDALLAVGL